MNTCLIFVSTTALLLIAVPQISSKPVQETDSDVTTTVETNYDPVAPEDELGFKYMTWKTGAGKWGISVWLYINNEFSGNERAVAFSEKVDEQSVRNVLYVQAELISQYYYPSNVGYSDFLRLANTFLSSDFKHFKYMIEKEQEEIRTKFFTPKTSTTNGPPQ